MRYDLHAHRAMTSDLRIIRNVKHTRASLIDHQIQMPRTSCIEINYATCRNHHHLPALTIKSAVDQRVAEFA